ncbi:heparinase II/III family protein [Pontibacter sp. E15-1]|uniref:alginate lyase family protein n=1 Tax=Pontibacter sp. E15-1 TaxID=2919918 RepID=UPI001F4F6C7B|nr:alginate lyase family protein [Pontibacter sp. E15-1]MCJ8164440.1 heparinase II/III family protein [Pontibacter sp. E15-1]
MGPRYVAYRVRHELEKKAGVLKRRFPENQPLKTFVPLVQWRADAGTFLFSDRKDIRLKKKPTPQLKQKAAAILEGRLTFFSSLEIDLGKDYDWLTNPDSGFTYDNTRHWSQISDLSSTAGDIKYVWEKSRFSYLHTILRYDYHFEQDSAEWVFAELDSWIRANPINCGPNYRCSQEISLRLFNWSYALHFYRHSPALTEDRWRDYQHYIYWQLHHVYHHIDFSRIAVRNNHAITETSLLCLSAFLFPYIPQTKQWAKEGRRWLEEEISYQIYEDGTFLQNSMNYHRVVVQVLTLVLALTEKNGNPLAGSAYEAAYKSVNFLLQCQQLTTGKLPNLGANDGALFFQFTDSDYNDYRPQLNSLHLLLTGENLYSGTGVWEEDAAWYGIRPQKATRFAVLNQTQGFVSFPVGGYYLIRDNESLSLIRCAKFRNRPSHADNLHLDVWVGEKNLLHDAGSYKYNTSKDLKRYFKGTQSHNTVIVDDLDQMLMGERFIWYHWSEAEDVKLTENDEYYTFEGTIRAFGHLARNVRHTRTVQKKKGANTWLVTDEVKGLPPQHMIKQLWHTAYPEQADLRVLTNEADRTTETGWRSTHYGTKEACTQVAVTTENRHIQTLVQTT